MSNERRPLDDSSANALDSMAQSASVAERMHQDIADWKMARSSNSSTAKDSSLGIPELTLVDGDKRNNSTKNEISAQFQELPTGWMKEATPEVKKLIEKVLDGSNENPAKELESLSENISMAKRLNETGMLDFEAIQSLKDAAENGTLDKKVQQINALLKASGSKVSLATQIEVTEPEGKVSQEQTKVLVIEKDKVKDAAVVESKRVLSIGELIRPPHFRPEFGPPGRFLPVDPIEPFSPELEGPLPDEIPGKSNPSLKPRVPDTNYPMPVREDQFVLPPANASNNYE